MNRESNTYTVIYSVILVLVVGVALSLVYQSLRPAQLENIADDTRRQILAAARIYPTDGENVRDLYEQHITDSFTVGADGRRNTAGANVFDISIADELKKPAAERHLPVFVCDTKAGTKYILPMYGAGLWGPIWGYIAFDSDGDTIYGAYFAHQGETPGLGAEIEKPAFSSQFEGKDVFRDGRFTSVAVVKQGQEPQDRAYVHAISGGTITSNGVQKMLADCLAPYTAFLESLQMSDNREH